MGQRRKRNKFKNIILAILFLALAGGSYFLYPKFKDRFSAKPVALEESEPVKIEEPEPTKIEEPETKEEAEKIHCDYTVTTLINEDYHPVVHEALQKAKKSIYIAMYAMKRDISPSGPVNTLLEDLVEAKERGVEVRVILQKPSPRWGGYSDLEASHREIINYLKGAGIEAKFDYPEISTHDKFILIDDDTIILGAHNWTYYALERNQEASVLIKSSPINPEFKRYFDSLEKQILTGKKE